jgi:hypothetical protein
MWDLVSVNSDGGGCASHNGYFFLVGCRLVHTTPQKEHHMASWACRYPYDVRSATAAERARSCVQDDKEGTYPSYQLCVEDCHENRRQRPPPPQPLVPYVPRPSMATQHRRPFYPAPADRKRPREDDDHVHSHREEIPYGTKVTSIGHGPGVRWKSIMTEQTIRQPLAW